MSLLKHQRRFKDVGIGGLAARWYDSNTRKNRLGEMRMYADIVSEYVNDGSHILEVAPVLDILPWSLQNWENVTRLPV